MKQTTAVEWLVDCIMSRGLYTKEMLEEFEQAKEIEKEQMIQARVTAPLLNSGDIDVYRQEAEQYYNETYKNEQK